MLYDPSTSILAGLDQTYLQVQLTAMQQAYVQLRSGKAVVSVSYTQGDGAKSVTYRTADMGSLAVAIRELQAQLGIVCQPRRAFGVRF
jgi:hypothetical protein